MISKKYKLSEAYFTSLRNRFYYVVVPIGLLSLFGGFGIPILKSGINIGVILIVPVFLIVMVISLRNSYYLQKQIWASYQLSIESDSISRSQNNFDTVKILGTEISSIKEYLGGSIVIQAGKKQIVIPFTLENFPEVRLLISQWHSIDVVKSKNRQNILMMFMIAILTQISLGIFVLSKDMALILTIGSILLIVLISSIFLIQRSNTLDNKVKRSVWMISIPILLIVARLYLLLFSK